MKKREKKMQLHRETVLRLNDLANARGGELVARQEVVGAWTSCIEPNCCGGTVIDTQ